MPSISSLKIRYINLVEQHAALKSELLEAVARVIDHGQFVLGEEVQQFEENFAKLCGTSFAVAVHSGTDALILALRALGIGSGDEVITAPNSFVASTSCIALVGARPVFVDVREDGNLDPTQLEAAMTSKTKAILPIHLTGRPSDMNPILEVARKNRLFVIEDCAQAVTAEYRGQRVGSFGVVGCFSLHPLKTLDACGDGGVLATNDEAVYKKLKLLRNLGLESRDHCVEWSSHSRLDTIQAAMLLVKLKYLNAWTEKRRSNAALYQKALAGIPEVQLPIDQPFERAVYHTFVIQADRRDTLKQFLADNGIETAIHYPVPIHLQKAAANLGYQEGNFPVVERQAKRILSLPVYPELPVEEVESVASSIKRFYGREGND